MLISWFKCFDYGQEPILHFFLTDYASPVLLHIMHCVFVMTLSVGEMCVLGRGGPVHYMAPLYAGVQGRGYCILLPCLCRSAGSYHPCLGSVALRADVLIPQE